MLNERRNFLKMVGSFAAGFSLLALSDGETNEGSLGPKNIEASSLVKDVDKSLKYLDRNEGLLPRSIDYFSSIHSVRFHPLEINIAKSSALILVKLGQDSDNLELGEEVSFEAFKKNESIYLRSTAFGYHLVWKPSFGLYSVDPSNLKRPLELCHPTNASLPFQPDHRIITHISVKETMISGWMRMMYWMEGVIPSPRTGFAGFCEETLQLDCSTERDQITAKGLNKVINTIPMGLRRLKHLAKASPRSAMLVIQQVIPRSFGWIMGPIEVVEEGKILIHNCQYRNRLGTYPCESTCGHAIGKYFTKEIGVPVRFDPTVENYTKCVILIGIDKFSQD